MIEKIRSIKNIAVFKDFNWDTTVKDDENNIRNFKKINIIYGRNYSGKTTLSRIIRALETGYISDKYDTPECCIAIVGANDISQQNFTSHNKTVRVFNEDFIKENLKFIFDPEENIQPFAILGSDNAKIEAEIKELNDKLGLNEEGNKTGLFLDLENIKNVYQTALKTHNNAIDNLNAQLSNKATNNPNGIKYQSQKFGDQNYTITKLKDEIAIIQQEDFKPISDDEKINFETLLNEKAKDIIPGLTELVLNFNTLTETSKDLITRKIGQSNKIEELLKNAVLNRWVKEGRQLHKDTLEKCAFCDNEIRDERWKELDKHFDEESDRLEAEIIAHLKKIDIEENLISSTSGIKRANFYSKFHSEVDALTTSLDKALKDYESSLKFLKTQLNQRKENILNEKKFEEATDYSSQIISLRSQFDQLRINSNEYSEKLSSEQKKAKDNLRLREIYDFLDLIEYDKQMSNIGTLKVSLHQEKNKKNAKQKEVDDILIEIASKQRELKDESKGADKVNEYLNNYFGHDFLTLKAIEFDDEESGNVQYRFEVHRDNKKAYHLSLGETSLIAFCYFMAKLQDIDTKTKKPIIWIDDPISSLDSNHIFFIYSLINTKIFCEEEFEQLFISTHNLNFLKYLKRLPGARAKTKCEQFTLERIDDHSTIALMPSYIWEYVTEFNYLFNQIYKCSTIDRVDDKNYTTFYNFGNNARKFLEIFLYYKYPDSSDDSTKMKRFFGDDDIPAVLTDRINNEYSHLSGVFERGATIVEVPEMHKAAKLILEKIKKDTDQYESLLKSIGVELITEEA